MENPGHMYILHYVFHPRINHAVESFTNSWNNHPLRTERNWSPNRIFNNGIIDTRNRHLHQISELQGASEDLSGEDLEWYGMDWRAPTPDDDGLSSVEVSDICSSLNEEQMENLFSIDPMALSNTFGIDVFVRCLQVV